MGRKPNPPRYGSGQVAGSDACIAGDPQPTASWDTDEAGIAAHPHRNRSLESVLVTCFSIVFTLGSPAIACGLVSQSAPATPTTQSHVETPASLPVVLSSDTLPGEASSEQQLAEWVRSSLADLDAAALAATATPEAGVRAMLEAANWILARQAEPQVSRLVFGIPQEQDVAELRSLVEAARQRLNQANELLATLRPADGETSDPELVKLQERPKELAAFADALYWAWDDSDAEDAVLAKRTAASEIAALIEDRRPQVAQTASLYQAVLFDQIDYDDRALQGLESGLQPLPSMRPELAFAARLLRCRILAQKGQYVAAWLLLLRMEEKIPQWFATPNQQEDAMRTAMLTRLAVTREWRDSQKSAGATELNWFEVTQSKILEALSADDASAIAVIRLKLAVPLLFEANAEPAAKDGAEE